MKKIKFTCSSCNAKLRVPTHLAGVSAPCPKCGSTITAPTDLENVVDDGPVRPAREVQRSQSTESASASGEPSVALTSPQVPVSVAATSASKISVSVGSGAVASSRVVPAPSGTESIAPEPAAPELPLETPVSAPTQEEPIIEETVLFDPPAPEYPEESAQVSPVAPSPIPIAPPAPAVAPPVPGAEEAPVETELAPPPPVPITQPIRIKPQASHLPPVRDENVEAPGELPRLDVNLAEQGEPGPDSFARNPVAPEGPVKVQLPQPGTEAERFAPDDFIVPSATEEAQGAYAPETPVSEVAATEMPVVESPEESIGGEPEFLEPSGVPLDQIDEPAPVQEPVVPQSDEWDQEYVPLELPPLDAPEQPVAEASPIQEPVPPQENFIAEAAAAQGMAQESFAEESVAQGHLDEGSFESLLAQQSQPAAGPEVPVNQTTGVSTEQPEGGLPFETGDAPREVDGQAAVTDPASVKSERDVLDEMFGGGQKTPEEAKKSTVLMLSILGATAIIAIIGVGVLIKAMGGLSVDHGKNAQPPAPPAAAEAASGKTGGKANAGTTMGSPEEPSIDDAPAVIDPIAQSREEANERARSTVTLPGEMEKPVLIVDSSGPKVDPQSITATEAAAQIPPSRPSSIVDAPAVGEPGALSFDERVQQIVNGEVGSSGVGPGPSVIGGASPADPVESALQDLGNSVQREAESALNSVTDQLAPKSGDAAAPKVSQNYNPASSFPAPGPEDGPLGKTHDLLDAFLRAPDWETRVKYVHGGESLRPAMEEYYKKWNMRTYDRFSKQLFQMEEDVEMGGPYWVFLVSTSDEDQGFPVIIRVEDGNLKIDWEIYSEFEDRHFVQFQKGAIASPHTFRLVVERVSDYYGSDRNGFTNLDDYYVYQINPPYGDLNEFSDYAFVKNDSEIAKKLDEVVGLGEQPLAVIVTLSQDSFDHGVKHLVITEYVTEGWFR
ncbi:MAG: hypothetical protein P1U87_07860 [Verrucomicrobiales bacterium]|nr:hypothetical protein [Verrucomicrobiales bacterium]